MNPLPSTFQALFPSATISALDAKRDKAYIIESLLKKATWQGWQWMLSTYSRKDLIEVLETSRSLSPKDVMLWLHHYSLNPKDIACLQTKSPQTPSSSWVY